jgi:hypothetical protein
MPQWFRSGDKTRFAAYQAAGRPFFYLQQAGRHQVPLSGHLSPNEAPSTDRHTFKGLPHAFFWAPGAYVHVLNPVGEWSKTINTCAAIKQDTGQRAVWSCLLRLSAHTSRWPTDAELTVLMVSIACFLHGYGVPRDPMMAHNLAAAVPVKDRGRALALGRAYAQRHQVVGLCARLSPELGLDYFFETECAPEPEPEGLVQWMNPLRWPTLAGTLLMGALEYAFDGDHDPCQPEG